VTSDGAYVHDPAHFELSIREKVSEFSLNLALAQAISSLPVPSPASGFTYAYDPTLRILVRSTNSFGPIFAERADTIGRNRFAFSLNFQNFSFDSINGTPLRAMPFVFEHEDSGYLDAFPGLGFDQDDLFPGARDVITAEIGLDASVRQLSFSASYGVSDRLDLSVLIPYVQIDMKASANLRLRRVGSYADANVHALFFGDVDVLRAEDSAKGLGDARLRGKVQLARSIAVGVDVRFPTGDEAELLGLGTYGVQPFAVVSTKYGRTSPHFNAAYLWNGESPLAAQPIFVKDRVDVRSAVTRIDSADKGDVPDELLIIGGVDIALSSRLTLAADLLGRTIINGIQPSEQEFEPRAEAGSPFFGSTFPDLRRVTTVGSLDTTTYTILDGSVGIKVDLGHSVLLTANMLFQLNENGLRDRFTPMIGIEGTF
jgi:hypothetical protein